MFVRLLILLTLLAGFSGFPLRAQQGAPSLSADVSNTEIGVGETATLILKSLNGDPDELPDRIDAEGLFIDAAGRQLSTQIVNGERTTMSLYLYRFRAEEAGTFVIPSITARIRGIEVSTAPIEVTVVERSSADQDLDATRPYYARLNLDKTAFYANEIVPFDVTVYVKGRNAISDVVGAELEHESFVIRNFQKVFTDAVEIDDSLYSLARLPSHLFALKPGRHTLGPAQVSVRVVDSQSGFGFPGIFQRAQTFSVSTPSLTIEIKPLPPGAPPSFTGGVGTFDLSLAPSTTAVSVGDPISLRFEVSGTGNLGTMGAPVMDGSLADTWRTYDATKTIDPEEESDGKTPGRVTFERVIIPLEATDEIPPFSLAFFDPVREEYVVRTTDPVPIEVSPDTGSDVAAPATPLVENPSGAGASAHSSAPPTPQPRFDDLLHIHPGPARLRPVSTFTLGPGPFFAGAQVFFSLAFFTLAGFGIVRGITEWRHAKATEHISLTFREAVRSVPGSGSQRGDFYRGVARALETWKKEHGDAPSKAREAIDRLAAKCGSHLYSGAGRIDEPVSPEEIQEFREVLALLSRKSSR